METFAAWDPQEVITLASLAVTASVALASLVLSTLERRRDRQLETERRLEDDYRNWRDRVTPSVVKVWALIGRYPRRVWEELQEMTNEDAFQTVQEWTRDHHEQWHEVRDRLVEIGTGHPDTAVRHLADTLREAIWNFVIQLRLALEQLVKEESAAHPHLDRAESLRHEASLLTQQLTDALHTRPRRPISTEASE